MMKTIAIAATAFSAANALNIFEDDHDFMKGFETGVMLRSKQTPLEEYGCKPPQETTHLQTIFGFITSALDGVKPFLPDDFELETGVDMVQTYINGMTDLISVIDPV